MYNKKKAIVLFGSPNENGYTATALNKLIESLKDQYDFSIINSYKLNIHACIDCKLCSKEHKCTFNDFKDIDTLIKNSELIVVASPVYNLSFPAPLKAIFDRMQIYFNSKTILKVNPIEKPKSIILILSYGTNDHNTVEFILKQLNPIMLLLNSRLIRKIIIKNTDLNPIIEDTILYQNDNNFIN